MNFEFKCFNIFLRFSFFFSDLSFPEVFILLLVSSLSAVLSSIMIHVSLPSFRLLFKARMLSHIQYSSPNKLTRGCLLYVYRFLRFAYTCSKKRKYRTSCNAIHRSFWSGRQCRFVPAPFCILIWLCNPIALSRLFFSWLLSCDARIIAASSSSVSDT